MDYFTSVERELSGALRRRADRTWRSRLGSRKRRLALAVVLLAATAGSALAATGVIPLGAPVHVPRGLNPRVGSGVPAPGGSALLPVEYPDPEGGPPWGMRVVHTTRGLVCVQVGRLQGGRLGELGIDGRFHDDGRFHPLPAAVLPDAGGGAAAGRPAPDTTCQLPSEPFLVDQYGVARGGGGPLDTTHIQRSRLRDLHYGLLGPQAISVSYAINGRPETRPVLAGLGAYLIVAPTTPRDPVATGGGSVGSFGGLGPVAPLTAIAYRLGGKVCERMLPGQHEPDPCPPPQSLYPPGRAARGPLHRPLRVALEISSGVVRAALVSFQAPLAVTGAGESYEVRAPAGPCHGGGGGFVSQNTDRDIVAGQFVRERLGDPFGNACGRRTVTLRVFYEAAGYPPREVGSAIVREPAGTRAETLGFGHPHRKS